MKKEFTKIFALGFFILLMYSCSQTPEPVVTSSELPVIPLGTDAYLKWEEWPLQRIGARAYMRSTYTRSGVGSDAGNFIFGNEEGYNVTLDVKGKGSFYFFRTNHWHGSPWHFVVDGKDNIVQETATADPISANDKKNQVRRDTVQNKVFDKTDYIPVIAFPKPLNQTWADTKGADLIWTPMPFKESFRIAYSRTRYGTGYYIYHLYADEDILSRPLNTWDSSQQPEQEVIDLLNSAGTDIAPKNIKKLRGNLKLDKERITLAEIISSPSVIRAVKFTISFDEALDLQNIRLIVTWDGTEHPSINAPLCMFFGAGTFYNRENREYLVKALPVNIRFDYRKENVELGAYFPMPFFKSAKFELAGIQPGDAGIKYEIRYEPMKTPANHTTYFHATFTDLPNPELGKDMVFLDTKGVEGNEDWSGNFIGTTIIFTHAGELRTLEADPRFFFDDSQTPHAQGTGTEEWGGGGDYWEGGELMTLPLVGKPVGSPGGKRTARNEHDLIHSEYRFLLADLMPFGKRAIIGFEHGDENLSIEHYSSVVYWYGVPIPTLVKTDAIDIGNAQSEELHNYVSLDASKVEKITSRYEWGCDEYPSESRWTDLSTIPNFESLKGKVMFEPHTLDGRYTRGTSEFTIALDPKNKGVMLRRTLDYSFPNQNAEVYITDASAPAGSADWKFAGIWYLSGSNTWLASNPPGEMDPRVINIQTSNRQFRDDEFLISRKLTENLSSARIKIKFVSDGKKEVVPGHPYPKESAWSELGYEVYSYVLPEVNISK